MTTGAPNVATESATDVCFGQTTRWLLLVTFSDFALLALQVLYLRPFSLAFHNSTYTFGSVLEVFCLLWRR